MPVYTLHTAENISDALEDFVDALTLLHSQTFGTDRAAVRVDIVIAPRFGQRHESRIERYGGVGFQWSAGLSGRKKTTEYLVAQINFRSSSALWEAYCRNIVALRRTIRSIYLQNLELEFERFDPTSMGKVITPPRVDSRLPLPVSTSHLPPAEDEPLPPYQPRASE